MTAGFPHHSRPGHYAATLDAALCEYVTTMAAAMMPGSGDYPSGEDAQVDHFVAERVSEHDVGLLAEVARRWPAASLEQARESLAAMEVEDAASFVYLREWLYHGYYSSRRVLAAMVDRGYRYHGAPQPLGYPKTEELLVPSERRGSYIRTEEVSRVSH